MNAETTKPISVSPPPRFAAGDLVCTRTSRYSPAHRGRVESWKWNIGSRRYTIRLTAEGGQPRDGVAIVHEADLHPAELTPPDRFEMHARLRKLEDECGDLSARVGRATFRYSMAKCSQPTPGLEHVRPGLVAEWEAELASASDALEMASLERLAVRRALELDARARSGE
jgi:hypothetical protein